MTKTTKQPRIIVERTDDQARRIAAELLMSIICEAVAKRDTCSLALAGGTTPHHLYQSLASQTAQGEVPWGQVEVFFGDERDVPHDHVESNYRMAQRTLLDNVPIQPAHVHPMSGDAEDLQAAAEEYENTIRNIVPAGADGIPRFDLLLLGMGGDGHTASLFPHTAALDEKKKLVAAHVVPVLGRHRLTFTFPLINAARNVILLVTGADKADATKDLLDRDEKKRKHLPAAGISLADGSLFVVLDEAAGRRAGLKAGQPDES